VQIAIVARTLLRTPERPKRSGIIDACTFPGSVKPKQEQISANLFLHLVLVTYTLLAVNNRLVKEIIISLSVMRESRGDLFIAWREAAQSTDIFISATRD